MNRQWLLHERPVGMIGPEHFHYVETDIPEPGEGEVLIRNLMFSFDPTSAVGLWIVRLLATRADR